MIHGTEWWQRIGRNSKKLGLQSRGWREACMEPESQALLATSGPPLPGELHSLLEPWLPPVQSRLSRYDLPTHSFIAVVNPDSKVEWIKGSCGQCLWKVEQDGEYESHGHRLLRRSLGSPLPETVLRSFPRDPHLENPNLIDECRWTGRIMVNSHASIMCKELDGALRRWLFSCGGLLGLDNTCLVFIASQYKGYGRYIQKGQKREP